MMRYDHLGRNKQTITSSSEVEKRAIGQKCRIVSAIVRRRMSGWTKEKVAKRAGLKQSAVARLENSPEIPRFDTLQKVAFGLGLCLELVTDDNEEAIATAQ